MLIVRGYNGRAKGAKFVHKGILLVSDPITHVELEDTETGLSYSSEYGIGPRRVHIGYSHPERWPEEYAIHLPLSPLSILNVLRNEDRWIALQKAGLVGYDTRGAIGCTVTGKNHPWDQFCSETVFDVIHAELGLSPALNYKMTPMKIIKTLKAIL